MIKLINFIKYQLFLRKLKKLLKNNNYFVSKKYNIIVVQGKKDIIIKLLDKDLEYIFYDTYYTVYYDNRYIFSYNLKWNKNEMNDILKRIENYIKDKNETLL